MFVRSFVRSFVLFVFCLFVCVFCLFCLFDFFVRLFCLFVCFVCLFVCFVCGGGEVNESSTRLSLFLAVEFKKELDELDGVLKEAVL